MEGNPVWSQPEYSYHLVTKLQKIKVLDQQEITAEMRTTAQKWNMQQTASASQLQAASAPTVSSSGSQSGPNTARNKLLKKIEERNVSISNAKRRWSFLKEQTCKKKQDEDKAPPNQLSKIEEPTPSRTITASVRQRPKIINITQVKAVKFYQVQVVKME